MDRSSWRESIADWIWFLGFALLSSAWCLTAAYQLGATWDEPPDLNRSMEFWRTGSHGPHLRQGTMPMPMDLAALPIYLWEQSNDTRVDFLNSPPEQALFWARATMLPFWWLLLLYARQAGKHLAGPWGGRLAVAILACEPSLLAHASLATKDLAISATLLALVYHFRTGREAGWGWRVGVPGLWFGVALLSKASALVFGPLCLLAVELEYLARKGAMKPADPEAQPGWRRILYWLRHAWIRLRPLRRDVLQAFALGLGLMMLYCGCDWQTLPSFVTWARKLPDGLTKDSLVWLADNLCIFHNGLEALVRQVFHNVRGHSTYLLGQSALRSIPFYFPLALSMKVTIPLLVLLAVLTILSPRALTNWACVAAGILFLFSVQCRVQIGIRLMLPLVVLAGVGLGAGVVQAWRSRSRTWQRPILTGCTTAGLLWSLWSCGSIWPHGLCYINELWGGTSQGYLCLSDSNYDWGQGLNDLALWQKRQGITNLDLWYFGSDPVVNTLPVRKLDCSRFPTPESLAAKIKGRFLAVSTTNLYGGYYGSSPMVNWLRAQRPADRTQTFLIYDFTQALEP